MSNSGDESAKAEYFEEIKCGECNQSLGWESVDVPSGTLLCNDCYWERDN